MVFALRVSDKSPRANLHAPGGTSSESLNVIICSQTAVAIEGATYSLLVSLINVGEWLSLVEHLVRDQGVGGSNPLSPTNYLNPVIELADFRFPKFPELGSIWVD